MDTLNSHKKIAEECVKALGLPKSWNMVVEPSYCVGRPDVRLQVFLNKEYNFDYSLFLTQDSTKAFIKTFFEDIDKEWRECDLVKRLIEEKTKELTEQVKIITDILTEKTTELIYLREEVKQLEKYKNYFDLTKEIHETFRNVERN